jgi:hypothetical protein
MGKEAGYEKQMLPSPDQQVSLTDPDSRSLATSGCGSGVVGYDVQVPSIPSIISLWRTRSRTMDQIGHNLPIWPSRRTPFSRSRRSRL